MVAVELLEPTFDLCEDTFCWIVWAHFLHREELAAIIKNAR
jgi:hypothetical protein